MTQLPDQKTPPGRELRVSIIFYNFTKAFQIPYLISVSEKPWKAGIMLPILQVWLGTGEFDFVVC